MTTLQMVSQGAARFDEKMLPSTALLDTTVWLRAFQWADDDDNLSEDFVDAMLVHKRRLLIAAPTIAELIRGNKTRRIPNRTGIVPVSFDHEAGVLLGKLAPSEWISEIEGNKTAIKFDALIVATAKRWNADCVVSLDAKSFMRRAAAAASIDLFRPERFLLPIEQQISDSKLSEKRSASQGKP